MTVEPKQCRECGKAMIRPRRNQTFCSAHCRKSFTERKKFRNEGKPIKKCPECGNTFEATRSTKVFCSTECQQAFNNFWKGKGPKIALALHEWRVNRKKGAMTTVCQEFSQARMEQKDRQIAKQKSE